MRTAGWQVASARLALAGPLVLLLVSISGCKVNVSKSQNGEDKNVDIETPVGGIHGIADLDHPRLRGTVVSGPADGYLLLLVPDGTSDRG